jgi:hypothetical protein
MHARIPQPASKDLACCNIDNSGPPLKTSADRNAKQLAGAAYRPYHVVSLPGGSPPPAASEFYVKPVSQKKTDLRI